MREINKIAENLFEKIRDRFEDVSLGDENAKATQSPESARFFNFDYIQDGQNYGNITISIIDEISLKIYFTKKLSHNLDEEQKKEWYEFLRELREFARRNLLSFEPRDITRRTLKHRDVQQVSKADSTYSKDEVIGEGYKIELAKSLAQKAANFALDAFTTDNVVDNETNHANPWGTTKFDKRMEKIRARQAREKARSIGESRLHGTQRSSYENDGNVRIIVRHSENVNLESKGARTRNIKSIFVETAEGERFKLPYNNLKYARAMARHISEGGQLTDEFGRHITCIAEEISKLRPFKSQMTRRTFEDAETQDMVEAAFEYHGLLNNTLKKMSSRKGYTACKESFHVDEETLMDDFDADSMRERFVRKTYNDATDSALPIVQKAYEMKKQNKFAKQFESWANNVAEGWAPDYEDLLDLLGDELPVGVDAINAINALEGTSVSKNEMFDNLVDDLLVLSEQDPTADARDTIMGWLQTELPNEYQQLLSNNDGDFDQLADYDSNADGDEFDGDQLADYDKNINEGRVKELDTDLKELSDAEFKAKYKQTKKEMRAKLSESAQLNEYLLRGGMPISEVLQLNVFVDMTEKLSENLPEWAEDADWMAIEQKYAPIAAALEQRIRRENRQLTDAEARAIERTWYDGSDAYEYVEDSIEFLPEIYDAQLDIVDALLAGNLTDEEFGDDEDFRSDYSREEELEDEAADERRRDNLDEDDEDDDYEEDEEVNEFYVVLASGDGEAFVGKLVKGPKWREVSVAGRAPYNWGTSYMSYLKPDDVMSWIHKDYNRYDVEGPFYDKSEAMSVAQQYGSLDEAQGDDYVNKSEKLKRMGAKPLGVVDKLKSIPQGMRSMAKGDSEDELAMYNKSKALGESAGKECPDCDGTGEGQYDGTRCRRCNGTGHLKDKDEDDGPEYERVDQLGEMRRLAGLK